MGRAGEELAAQWYTDHGYEVVDRNWRWREGGAGRRIDGEVDIVAVGHGTVVFCEVKSRADSRFGGPFAAVTPRKQDRLRRLAVAWLAERRPGRVAVRFDVAAVVGGRLEMLEGAF
ncbi:MAG: hypothetical protein RJB61_1191 [Actinomycetota bacterium]